MTQQRQQSPEDQDMKAMFLTGATGFVGGEVIKRYLERSPDLHIVAMIRAVDEDRLEKRVD